MIPHKNETEDNICSLLKLVKRLNKQTHTEPQETLEFNLTKSRETSILLGLDFNSLVRNTQLEMFFFRFIINLFFKKNKGRK